MPLSELFILIIVVVCLGLGLLFGFRKNPIRARILRNFAKRKHLSYYEENRSLVSSLHRQGFSLVREKGNRFFYNILSNQIADLEIIIADYHSKGRFTTIETVAILRTHLLGLPEFHLHPSDWMDDVALFFSDLDINTTEYPAFAKHYLLDGPDRHAIQRMFTPEVLTYFNQRLDLNIQVRGSTFLLFYPGSQIEVDDIENFRLGAIQTLELLRSAYHAP